MRGVRRSKGFRVDARPVTCYAALAAVILDRYKVRGYTLAGSGPTVSRSLLSMLRFVTRGMASATCADTWNARVIVCGTA